ncbi:hypothetical protein [Kitasatospora cheerisanensis]|uniref:Uncharacterized protein n=1 Tax=Kitasatospora cheerisanensis KCTC 2395 TaxID=1348663 RepID=A0A066Z1L8_9ACTN|nr:hypothetical protein [Kitasatospora cheerisanensis]KDN86134.1 hypothetical protein KCH_19510 [Kitasatospora cheerisanensis KCTC 2395]
MERSDRSRAVAGLLGAALGAGLGLAVLLSAWGVLALAGDGAFPSGLVFLVLLPVGGTLRPLWDRRPVNRRPALLVALSLFLLLAADALVLGADSAGEQSPAGLLLGVLLGVLLSGAVLGALAGEPAEEPGRHWLRFTGRGRCFHLAVHGALLALLAATAAVVAAFG